MDCSPPVPGILQARILEWVAISSSRESSHPRDQIWLSCIADRFFTIWTTREVQFYYKKIQIRRNSQRERPIGWGREGETAPYPLPVSLGTSPPRPVYIHQPGSSAELSIQSVCRCFSAWAWPINLLAKRMNPVSSHCPLLKVRKLRVSTL